MSTTTADANAAITQPGGNTELTGKKPRGGAGKVFSAIGIALIIIYCLAPFYWMLVSSLRPDREIFENTWWPRHASLENYRAVFAPGNNFLRALGNSAIVSISVTIVALLIATFASYALARLEFRGKGAFLVLVLSLIHI